MTSQGTMSLGHSWGSRSTESRFVLPGTTRASLNGEDARANQRGAEVELVAAQGDADRADIDAAAAQTELDMAQQAASDADAAVATAQAKSDAAAVRASQLKNAAASLAKATEDKAAADTARDAAAKIGRAHV